MNYEEISDFEINVCVANAIHGSCEKDERNGYAVVRKKASDILGYDAYYNHHADYCNNWSDGGPVIEENNIWIQPDMIGDGLWHCYDREDKFHSKHKNPLRAAMIVFLMMKDAEK